MGPAVQESKEFKHKIKELEKKIRWRQLSWLMSSAWAWSSLILPPSYCHNNHDHDSPWPGTWRTQSRSGQGSLNKACSSTASPSPTMRAFTQRLPQLPSRSNFVHSRCPGKSCVRDNQKDVGHPKGGESDSLRLLSLQERFSQICCIYITLMNKSEEIIFRCWLPGLTD